MCAFAGVAARGDTRLSACVFPKFDWLAPGNGRTFTFTYVHAGGVRSATITFNVSGPTATGPLVGQGPEKAFFEATVRTPPQGTTPVQIVNVWPGNPPYLGFGKNGLSPGISFDVTATGGSGAGSRSAFQFVQLITQSMWKYRSHDDPKVGGLRIGLDEGWYPYATTFNNANQALDFPNVDVTLDNDDAVAEVAVRFAARMYVLWDPALPNGCTPATKVGGAEATVSYCTDSIPIPLGHIAWGFSGDAIITGAPGTSGTSNQTSWIMLNCGGPSPMTPTFTPSIEHPTW
jgi:hypothetical protein